MEIILNVIGIAFLAFVFGSLLSGIISTAREPH